MKRFTLLLLLLGSISLVQAQQKIEFEEFDLDNGLHVILHEDHSAPIVAVTVMYHVGSKNEDTSRTGFAHFFEHLLFEGSENIKRGEFDTYVESAGGMLNANTSQDRTFYYEVLPSNQLELGLWLESERMMHARVDETGVETQREVVKEEKRQRIDNRPYGAMFSEIFDLAYDVHPYRWAPIGSMAHLNAATESDYVNFYKKYYVPNNACLSIAGDIDMKQAKAWVKKYFTGIPKGGKIDRPDVKEPALGGEKRGTYYDNIQLPAIIHGFRIPEQGTQDFYALEMLSILLSRGESSRLNSSLVDEKQLALNTGAFAMGLEDPGLFLSFAICNMGKDISEVEAALDAEYEKVRTELITEREYQKIQNIIENQYVNGLASISSRAESLANYYVYFGDANLVNTEIDRYRKITREDLKRVANKYLVKSNRVSLEYLPISQKPKNE